MIARILEIAVRQRVLVLMGALGLLVAGIWSVLHLSVDAVPDIIGVQVQVNAEVPALAPEEVEKLVTFPLETELAGVPGVTEMRSLSKFGLSQITLQFTDSTDIYRARQLVTERLQGALESLPPNITPRLAPVTTGLGEVFHYAIDYAPEATNKPATRRDQLIELELLQEYTLKPILRAVPGVAEINAGGGYEKQLVVQPNLEKLRAANLTVQELADIISRDVENIGGGTVRQGDKQLLVRGVGRVSSAAEISALPVKFAAGVQPLRVGDVAEVSIGTKIRTGAATVDGEEGIVVMAMMLTGQNSHHTARRVAARLAEAQKQLPPGVIIKTLHTRADLVSRTISTVEKNLGEGAILVVAVLLLMLGNWRAALIVASAIPLAFLFAITGMNYFGISGNLMSLGAIDFGLIIDGAVVIAENVVRQLGQRQHELGRTLTSEERTQVVLSASKQVGTPMFFGMLIITIVYVPILALTGIEGKMFHPMAITVMLALGGALVLALMLMPALCSLLLGGKIHEGDNRLLRLLKRPYERVLNFALRFRWAVTIAALLLFAASAWTFTKLGEQFIPTLDEGSLIIQFNRPPSISLEASIDEQCRAEKLLRQRFPEIQHIFSNIGTPEVATDPMGVNQGDTWVMLKPRREWRKVNGRLITKAELSKEMHQLLEQEFKDTELFFSQPIEMRFNELLEGIRADISIKIYGDDYDVTEKLARELKELLETIPGADEIEFETLGRSPLLEISVKRDALSRYNVHAADVNQVIGTALAGRNVGVIVDGNRRFDLVVRLPETAREDLSLLRELPVRVGEHGALPLSMLAEFKVVQTVSPILRESSRRRSALLVELETDDVEGWVRTAQQKVAAQIKIPEGVNIEFGGQFENLVEAKARLAIVVPGALVLIFVLIVTAFGSLRQALLVYSGIPLALTGGVFALWLRDYPFSITAAVGFIALSGVAVLNGVVLVSYFNQLRAEGMELLAAVRQGALTRLRPVLMTAAVASLGFVPMALATGPGAEVQRPLATVVIGGVLSSTFLTLILLPVLFAWVEGARKKAKQY